jgi:hypothetical protein
MHKCRVCTKLIKSHTDTDLKHCCMVQELLNPNQLDQEVD